MAGITVPLIATADTAGIKRFESQFASMSKKLKKQSDGFDKLGSSLKKALGVGAILELGKKALDEAANSYQVSQLTNTVIKNTGAAAWTSTKQISAMAMSLSNIVGVDDELIQAGSNVLLSFQNIRNAGKGNAAIFDRATAAATDMSKALGMDVPGAAKILGKALADPVKGTTALRKAGIVLTNEQQAQIKAMQQRGDLLGAQQTILAAVEGRYKGAAAAMATPMEKLQVIMNNLLETLGTPLMNALGPILTAIRPALEALSPVLSEVGSLVAFIVTQFVKGMKPIFPIIIQAVKDALPAFSSLIALFEALLPAIQPSIYVFAILAKILGTVIPPIVRFLANIMAGLIRAFKGVVDSLAPLAEWMGSLGRPVLIAQKALGSMVKNLDDVQNMKFDLTASDALAQQASNYSASAKQIQAGAKATANASKDFAKGAKTKRIAAPKTRVSTPTTNSGDQSFMVSGSGGGLSLSVTVNGSVVQERDIARTIRNEIIQLTRRQGMTPNFGV